MDQILQPHPLATNLPAMSDEEYADVKASIETRGQLEPCYLLDGMILDGRHRYRACTELGIECQFEDLPEGMDPADFVIDRNVNRRQLAPGERARVALLCYEWRDRGRAPAPDSANAQRGAFNESATAQGDSPQPAVADGGAPPAETPPEPAEPTKPEATAAEIADRVGVSQRTVVREKAKLREERGETPQPTQPAERQQQPSLRDQNRDLRQALGEQKAEVVSLKQQVADLEARINEYAASADPETQAGISKMTDIQRENEVLRARAQELQQKNNERNGEVRALKREAKVLKEQDKAHKAEKAALKDRIKELEASLQ